MKKALYTLWGISKFRFVVIGFTNTVIDFLVLNFLFFAVGLPRIPSNLGSTTVAMTVSFMLNQRLVFKKAHDNRHVVPFVAITLFGLYGIQTFVILLFTEWWLWPLDTVIDIIGAIGLGDLFSSDFVYTNGSKVLAAASTMIWNYKMYSNFVFAPNKSNEQSQSET